LRKNFSVKKIVNVVISILLLPFLILAYIGMIYIAFFYQVPTFESLLSKTFNSGEYRAYCATIIKKGPDAYKPVIYHGGIRYEYLYELPDDKKCYEELSKLNRSNITIWYENNLIIRDYLSGRKYSTATSHNIYQLKADNNYLIKYHKMFFIKKEELKYMRCFIALTFLITIYIFLKKRKRNIVFDRL